MVSYRQREACLYYEKVRGGDVTRLVNVVAREYRAGSAKQCLYNRVGVLLRRHREEWIVKTVLRLPLRKLGERSGFWKVGGDSFILPYA